jgi:hypothetical protein
LFIFLLLFYRAFLISSKLFYQQMHFLLKHKMLQLTLKISLYMGSYMFRSERTETCRSCSILCFNKKCICWQRSFELLLFTSVQPE